MVLNLKFLLIVLGVAAVSNGSVLGSAISPIIPAPIVAPALSYRRVIPYNVAPFAASINVFTRVAPPLHLHAPAQLHPHLLTHVKHYHAPAFAYAPAHPHIPKVLPPIHPALPHPHLPESPVFAPLPHPHLPEAPALAPLPHPHLPEHPVVAPLPHPHIPETPVIAHSPAAPLPDPLPFALPGYHYHAPEPIVHASHVPHAHYGLPASIPHAIHAPVHHVGAFPHLHEIAAPAPAPLLHSHPVHAPAVQAPIQQLWRR